MRLGVGMGEGEGVVRLSESLQIVTDWWQRPDWAVLAGDSISQAFETVNAAVGFRSMIALNNPANSGRVLILEAVAATVAGSNLRWTTNLVAGVGGWVLNTTTWNTRDSRVSRSGSGQILANNTTAVAGTLFNRLFVANATEYISIVIGHQTALIVEPNADNQSFAATLRWRERQNLPGEPRA